MTDFCDLQTVVYAGILTLMIAVIQTELVHPAIVMNVTVGSHIQRQFAQYRQTACITMNAILDDFHPMKIG